jgi:flagellar protein FlbT
VALALNLKPGERAILGNAVIRNAGGRVASLLVETPVPVLRQRDVLPESKARTPCARIYLIVQLLYIDPENRAVLRQLFLQTIREVFEAAPSMRPLLERVSVAVAKGAYYRALKGAQGLLDYERQLLEHADAAPSIRQSEGAEVKKLSRAAQERHAASRL